VVRAEEAGNTGFIARLCANFDADLRLVEPCFNLSEARETASRAQQEINRAEIFGSLADSLQDLDFVLGSKPGRGRPIQDITAPETASLVVGPESSGLSNSELDMCDGITHIETSDYSSINQSHAAAIMMSHLYQSQRDHADPEELGQLSRFAGHETMRVLERGNPTEDEIDRIIGELSQE